MSEVGAVQSQQVQTTKPDTYETFTIPAMLSRIPSVHSMRDIPYVDSIESEDASTPDILKPTVPLADVKIPETPGTSYTQSVHSNDGGIAGNTSSTSRISRTSLGGRIDRSISTSSVVSGLADLSLHSSRTGISKTLSLTSAVSVAIDGRPQSLLTPITATTAEIARLNALRKRLNDDIANFGPSSINAMILSSVYERFNSSFSDTLNGLIIQDSIDVSSFLSVYYQVLDIHRQMQRIGPMGLIFPQASQLSEFIKWDYRQLVNSFLTLLRTSPGFIATAYLELGPRYTRLFLGKAGDSIEDIVSAQRRCPLGIIFHGMIRNPRQRINYFAALCAQLYVEANDESVVNAVFSKFTQSLQFLTAAPTRKLDRYLRKLIAKGQQHTVATPNLRSSIEPPGSPEVDEFWLEACRDLCAVLMDKELLCPDFNTFVAALKTLVPSFVGEIDALAFRHYTSVIRHIITHPHRYGILTDVYISDATEKFILGPLVQHFSDFLKDNSEFKQLADTVLGRNITVTDLDNYFEPGQHMVLSLSEIIFLYQSIFPTSALAGGASMSSRSTLASRPGQRSHPEGSPDMEENEWCLENIQADLEPVMKDLASKLPRSRGNLVRHQLPGLFADYWQVFKIEVDGLVNDTDSNSWKVPKEEFEAIYNALRPNQGDIYTILNDALVDAEQRGDHSGAFHLRRIASLPGPGALQTIFQNLEQSTLTLSNMKADLQAILDTHVEQYFKLTRDTELIMTRLNEARLHIWYEHEVRSSSIWQRSKDVVMTIRGEAALQRANSGSSMSSLSRRFSTRNRRLSLLSTHSLNDSFFVSKDYLIKPKLADREVDYTLKYFKHGHIRNFCRCEELIHRFNAEIYTLLHRILDRDYLIATTASYKRDIRREPNPNVASHRMSMSVLPDLRAQSRAQRKSSSSLLDIFEWKSSTDPSPTPETTLGFKAGDDSIYPHRDTLCGLLLSDLGNDFITKGSETDEYMQQTGRMVLDGDGLGLQGCLDDISIESAPEAKLAAFSNLVKLVTARLSVSLGVAPSRADISHELSKGLGREPGTLFRDLQIVAGLAPTAVLDQGDQAQAFWDVAEVAELVLDSVVTKSMDLAVRMLRYQNETAASTQAVANMAVSDSVAIWSFCARQGVSQAQYKLGELFLQYPHTMLEVMPLSRPAIVFEGIELSQARNAVAAHWMQNAAQQGHRAAQEYCKKHQNVVFI